MNNKASRRQQEAQEVIERYEQAHPELADREISVMSDEERHTFLDWLVIWLRQTDQADGNEGMQG